MVPTSAILAAHRSLADASSGNPSRLIFMDDPANAGEAALDLASAAFRRQAPITWMGYAESDVERLAALDVELHGGPRASARRFERPQGSHSLGWHSEIGGDPESVASLMSSLVNEGNAGQWTPRLRAMVYVAVRAEAERFASEREPFALEALKRAIILERLVENSESPAVSPACRNVLLDYLAALPGYRKGAHRQSDETLEQHGYLQMLEYHTLAVIHGLVELSTPWAPAAPRWDSLGGGGGDASHFALLPERARDEVGASDLVFGCVKLGLETSARLSHGDRDRDARPRAIFARDCQLPAAFRQTLDLAGRAGASVVLQFESAEAMRALMVRPEEFFEVCSWFEREELRRSIQSPSVRRAGESRARL